MFIEGYILIVICIIWSMLYGAYILNIIGKYTIQKLEDILNNEDTRYRFFIDYDSNDKFNLILYTIEFILLAFVAPAIALQF